MTIFFIVSGMGLVFMLYVFANFVKEGRRMPPGRARTNKLESLYGSKEKLLIAVQPVELADSLPEGATVIPFPVLEGRPRPVGGRPAPDGGKPAQRKYSVG